MKIDTKKLTENNKNNPVIPKFKQSKPHNSHFFSTGGGTGTGQDPWQS